MRTAKNVDVLTETRLKAEEKFRKEYDITPEQWAFLQAQRELVRFAICCLRCVRVQISHSSCYHGKDAFACPAYNAHTEDENGHFVYANEPPPEYDIRKADSWRNFKS